MVLFLALVLSVTFKLCEGSGGHYYYAPPPTTPVPPYLARVPKVIIQRKELPFTSESFIDSCYYENPFALFLEESLLVRGERRCFFCLCQHKDAAFCFERMDERCMTLGYHHPYLRISRYGSMPGRQRYKRTAVEEKDFPKMFVVRQAPTPFATCQPLTSKPYSIGYPPDDWCKGSVTCMCTSQKKYSCYRISYCAGDEYKAPSKKLLEKHL